MFFKIKPSHNSVKGNKFIDLFIKGSVIINTKISLKSIKSILREIKVKIMI